ncbi:uncharacterized protein LOC124920813 isoform X2 [Impatiens glandulifera]|uniref:uncharacterized protein LOC124920813 isoform X2 n=1 Tax=Impatiens glandulifera TaxID=253017 RepID=UPI001FB1A179|nr:uncharacterized protein LOC124920813 isoform X2 [Impatiens glandulifera]
MTMEDMDEPLDFEAEDLQLRSLPPVKKRKQLINLDDLLNDHMKEKETLKNKRLKKAKREMKRCTSDDEEEDNRVVLLTECVDRCQKEIGQISGDDEIHKWGLHMFRNQKSPPPTTESYELESCGFFQSFMSNKLNLIVELDITKGDAFFEQLLINGWLIKLVLNYGHVERPIALWTFGKVMYSSDQVLSTSACDFWCEILASGEKVKIDWLPCFSDIKTALEVYGFKLDSQDNTSSEVVTTDEGSYYGQPPQNIRTWIKYVASCFRVRKYQFFSNSEAEELLVDVGYLFLDRHFMGLSVILSECLLSAVSFFTDGEWNISCEKIAHSLAYSIPKDMNCLKIVEIIPAVNVRSKHLRRTVAFHMLQASFDNKTSNSEGMLRVLGSISMKDENSDLFKVYIRLSLAENWLLCNPLLEMPAMSKLWNIFLRNCSCQITVSDIRPYSSKVRSKASYLLQDYTIK